MNRLTRVSALLGTAMALALAAGACRKAEPPATTTEAREPGLLFLPDIPQRLARLPLTTIDYDRSMLKDSDRPVLDKLIEASRHMDAIFLRQVSEENPALRAQLAQGVADAKFGASDALLLFDAMKGPWDRIDESRPFIGSKPKPPGAGFYPADLTKAEFEAFVTAHPDQKAALEGLNTIVRRDAAGLVAIPYAKAYEAELAQCAAKLREAATMTDSKALAEYLTKLADALASNDYFASDMAWMDTDADIEFVLGPYEVYEDKLFNFKAAFTAFVTVRDRVETEKLAVYAAHLRDMERNLPIADKHKNVNRPFRSPLRVVQEAFTAGDARRGVQTAAFNLPNDERVREARGSKQILLKNVMQAKFEKNGKPVSERVLTPEQQPKVIFPAFFDHTLFHELAHGLGPGQILKDGKKTEVRLLLKDTYSTIEECKADVVGTTSLLYSMDRGWHSGFDAETFFVTQAGLMFRSMRFGIDEAHGRGTAIQWNWYREKGGIVPAADGRFGVDVAKFRAAVESLARELLEIQATGDYDRAGRLLEGYGKSNEEIQAVNARVADVPVDIRPVFPAAGEK
jgi:hypothetical protein